jgi:hypothetical protein
MGLVAVTLGLASTMMPYFAAVFFVPIAVVCGIIAFRGGQRGLGGSGVALGVIGLIGIVSISNQLNESLKKFRELGEQPQTTIGSTTACVPYDDLSHFKCRFGRPDVENSTEYERPRPTLITRWIVYNKERVRITYMPNPEPGELPPYRNWNFFSFQDSETNSPLSAAEVVNRLSSRDTQKKAGPSGVVYSPLSKPHLD